MPGTAPRNAAAGIPTKLNLAWEIGFILNYNTQKTKRHFFC